MKARANNREQRTQQGRTIDRRALGERLRNAREYLGLSQEEVARHLRIPRSALSNIENGQRGVDALELKNLALLYKLSVAYLTGDAPKENRLPEDVMHLARSVATLSKQDRKELTRFAEYLRARAQANNE